MVNTNTTNKQHYLSDQWTTILGNWYEVNSNSEVNVRGVVTSLTAVAYEGTKSKHSCSSHLQLHTALDNASNTTKVTRRKHGVKYGESMEYNLDSMFCSSTVNYFETFLVIRYIMVKSYKITGNDEQIRTKF